MQNRITSLLPSYSCMVVSQILKIYENSAPDEPRKKNNKKNEAYRYTMPPRIDYGQEIGQARAVQIIAQAKEKRCHEDPETGCWLFTGSKNTDGYGQVMVRKNSTIAAGLTGRRSQTAMLLHKIAYVAEHGHDVTDHGSHICSRPACFREARR